MFHYFEASYDSDDHAKLVEYYSLKSLPAIIYYPKSVAKKQIQRRIFYKNDHYHDMKKEISTTIDDFTVPLSDELEAQQMTSIAIQDGKFVVILFHDREISMSYRILSNDDTFKEELTFFRYKDPSP